MQKHKIRVIGPVQHSSYSYKQSTMKVNHTKLLVTSYNIVLHQCPILLFMKFQLQLKQLQLKIT